MSKEIIKSNKTYIIPRIQIFQSFREATPGIERSSFLVNKGDDKEKLRDYFTYPRMFVVAEAGFGKTRLLKELTAESSLRGKKSICVDLKKMSISETLVDFIDKQIIEQKIKPFSIVNSEELLVCFDALDEVKQEEFSATVEKLKTLAANYPKLNIVVACRWYFFQKYQELFIDSDFRYAHISQFSLNDVRRYLKTNLISGAEVEKLINSLNFKNRELIIQTPRYLELLVDYINNIKSGNVDSVTRTDLFEYFIYKKLELEDKNLTTQKKDLIKRVLEKLALLMEIYQTNILTKDELMTFFDDLKSDLKASFLQQVPIEIFYDKTALKDNGNTIEFENTEFQEYLASKEISRLGHPLQTVFDLIVDQELREIYASWSNALTFLIELDITLLKPILDFTNRKNDGYLQGEEYHRLITRVNINQLSVEDQKSIFEQVFEYYQSVLHWIDWDIASNLARYFDISQHYMLEAYVNKIHFSSDTERFVQLGNLVLIVGFLIERDIFNQAEKTFWKKNILKYAKDKNKNGVLQRHALFALEKLMDDSIIDKIDYVWKHDEELVRSRFLELCSVVNPNHVTSVKYFVEGVKQQVISARYGLFLVSEPAAIKKLLQYFINDEVFLYQFIDHESIYEKRDRQIIEHIVIVWDADIKNQLEQIICNVFASQFCYHAEKSDFIKSLALVLKEKNKDYIFELLKQIKTSNELKNNLFSFLYLFASILQKNQIKSFLEMITEFDNGTRFALWTLQQIKFSKRSDAKDIYEEGRKYLAEEYKISEKHWKKEAKRPPEEIILHQEFQYKLEPIPGQYMTDVFEFYIRNENKIEKFITDAEKKKLIDLVINIIFEKFDPSGQDIKITKQEDGHKRFTVQSWIPIFGDCLLVAQRLKLDVSKYRGKIISYLPFAYHDHRKAIFEMVKHIKPEEIKTLLNIYNNKSSDLWGNLPDGLIEATIKYQISEAVPILKEFINQNDFFIHDRIAALEASETLNPDQHFLESIFEEYSKTQPSIADKANELLIEKYRNTTAINRRFAQIKDRAFKFKKPVGVHSVSDQESELHDKKFAIPLINLKDLKFQNNFLNLLGFSFALLKKDESYYPYVHYLWQIVSSYFENLKEGKSYDPLKTLGEYSQKHSTEGTNWFTSEVNKLRLSYMNFLGKPNNIAECILKYNNLKTMQYLDINTPRDLFEKLKNIISHEVRDWVTGEGVKLMNSIETDAQKHIKTQLEISFLRKGFRPNEIAIIREPQMLNDKRTDFLLSYGFIGPIVLEIKMSDSSDLTGRLKNKKSYKNLQHYLINYNAYFGIFLVIDSKQVNSWPTQFEKVKEAYQEIENVEVIEISK